MKQVEWLAPSALSVLRVAAPGALINLPDDLADKFIAQGEARMPLPVQATITRPKAETKGGDV